MRSSHRCRTWDSMGRRRVATSCWRGWTRRSRDALRPRLRAPLGCRSVERARGDRARHCRRAAEDRELRVSAPGHAVVLLAAGESRRLGEPKQLVVVDGEPLVRRAALAAIETRPAQALIVVGARAEAVWGWWRTCRLPASNAQTGPRGSRHRFARRCSRSTVTLAPRSCALRPARALRVASAIAGRALAFGSGTRGGKLLCGHGWRPAVAAHAGSRD